MKQIKNLLLLLTAMFFIACTDDPIPVIDQCDTCKTDDPEPKPNVKYAGIRSSYYGFAVSGEEKAERKFPTPDEAAKVIKNIAALFPGAIPSAVWIIGGIDGTKCNLEFDGTSTDPNIRFLGEHPDFWGNVRPYSHMDYLDAFDKVGAKVFLQVEAGQASMDELIRLCLGKYGNHNAVAGFGFDVEWFPSNGKTNGLGEMQQPLSSTELQRLTNLVKTYGKELKVMSKHWETNYVGGTANKINDVIYFSSSQDMGSGTPKTFADDWADKFNPSPVGFQLGYHVAKDYNWWKTKGSTGGEIIKNVTEAIFNRMKNKEQEINVYWVDFTIRWSEFEDLWQ